MFASNCRGEEAKKLFAYLGLMTNNIFKLDILITVLKNLEVDRVKYGLISDDFPMPGGTILKSIGLIIEFLESIESVRTG